MCSLLFVLLDSKRIIYVNFYLRVFVSTKVNLLLLHKIFPVILILIAVPRTVFYKCNFTFKQH